MKDEGTEASEEIWVVGARYCQNTEVQHINLKEWICFSGVDYAPHTVWGMKPVSGSEDGVPWSSTQTLILLENDFAVSKFSASGEIPQQVWLRPAKIIIVRPSFQWLRTAMIQQILFEAKHVLNPSMRCIHTRTHVYVKLGAGSRRREFVIYKQLKFLQFRGGRATSHYDSLQLL